ncbi:hypothetical protein BCR34DRAFT_482583 [Clohesyomyces aquaticus]|uniref:Uncharacterized protein n=1 Tax=Clohesyomyces aquaticus TaxID=1231657 RepID=A0A1Y1ZQ88_9PLEO|nr:hypothetical protein BCR34DRAFT_482583 [Clohesyomyces aquaticus]
MHRKHQISALVYNRLYPNPSPTDPPNFAQHLAKYLVGEVRIETATFYGSLDTIEARYPGLNYAHAPHRMRLGRFPHHKKLFEAFDRLGLTESEIQGFCRWEGTLWARERYERDEGVKVRDTTGMQITEWVDRRKHRISGRNNAKGINVKTDIEVEIEDVPVTEEMVRSSQIQTAIADTDMRDEDDEESDEEDESVGFELNQRLLHAAALRDQGVNVAMDPEWEQYLKEAQERGELNIEATQEALRSMAAMANNSHATDSSQSYQPHAAPA